MPAIRLENVEKIYKQSGRKFPAVLRLDMVIKQGEFVCLAGKRGSGTTLALNIICGQVTPDKGRVYFGRYELSLLPWLARKHIERSFGVVWQTPALTADKTSVMSCFGGSGWWGELKMNLLDRPRARKALSLVGLDGCEDKRLREFTPAQLRRLEVARAILHSPPVLIIDDLSDTMDEESLWDIIQLLRELNRRGTTIIMAAHSGNIINIIRPRVITLSESRIKSDETPGKFGDTVKL